MEFWSGEMRYLPGYISGKKYRGIPIYDHKVVYLRRIFRMDMSRYSVVIRRGGRNAIQDRR